jgi:acetyl esterase/lipase
MNVKNLHTQEQIKRVDFPTKNIDKTIIHNTEIIPEWRENRGYILKFSNKKYQDNNKCILYVHGGGFTANQPKDNTYITLCAILVHLTKCDVYCPDYTLAPDASYPTQPNQIINLAKKLKGTYSKIILGSDSAGGCIAMTCLLSNSILFYSSFFISPYLNLKNDSESYKTRAWCEKTRTGDPIFYQSSKEVKKYSDKLALEYLKYKKYLNDPIANPFLATKTMIKKLPPLLIICGDNEILRNDSVEFCSKAQEVNDNVHFSLYDGMWHDWPLYYQTASKNLGEQSYYQIAGFCDGIRRGKTFKYKYQKSMRDVKCNIFL